MIWLWITFGAQATLMAIDEGYFHRKRKLPLWERVGHPVDTASVLLLQGAVLFTSWSLPVLVGLAILSTVMITKDEWIHHRECEATETWIHSLLFVLHPVYLGLWIWVREQGLVPRHPTELMILFTGTLGVAIYQILYWNTSLHLKFARARS